MWKTHYFRDQHILEWWVFELLHNAAVGVLFLKFSEKAGDLVPSFEISQWEYRLHQKEPIILSVTYESELSCFMNTDPSCKFYTYV